MLMRSLLLAVSIFIVCFCAGIVHGQTIVYDKKVYQKKWTQRSVLSQRKGFRPTPENYLKTKYVRSVLKKFNKGASFIISADTYNNAGALLGDKSDCQYVYSTREMDAIMAKCKGNSTLLEQELYLRNGSLYHKKMMRIDVPHPKAYMLRIPSGNEPSAPDSWIPAGHYPNGYLQAVINRVPKSEVTATQVQ